MMTSSRSAAAIGLAAAALAWSTRPPHARPLGRVSSPRQSTTAGPDSALLNRLTATAARSGLVVGLGAVDLGSGRRVSLRGGERFPMASVYKLPIALRVAHLLDRGALRVDSVVTIPPDKFAPHYSPLAERAGSRPVALTVDSLLALMLGGSDNTASDAMLRLAGGAPAVTRHLRTLGITGVRVDRSERELGVAQRGIARIPAGRPWSRALFDSLATAVTPAAQRAAWARYQQDPRDTATPDAMADLLAAFARGAAGLRPESRRRLLDVMRHSPTGAGRIRAGVPAGSLVAHKTGSAGPVVNDVALVTLPRGRGELALAVFVRGGDAPDAAREALIAELTREVVEGLFPASDAPR